MGPKRVTKAASKAAGKKGKAAPPSPATPKLSRKSSKVEDPEPPKLGKRKNSAQQPVAPKKAKGADKYLDLALLMDCTASMYSWIDRSKTTLKTIIDNVVASSQGLKVRITYIGYRDFGDSKRFEI